MSRSRLPSVPSYDDHALSVHGRHDARATGSTSRKTTSTPSHDQSLQSYDDDGGEFDKEEEEEEFEYYQPDRSSVYQFEDGLTERFDQVSRSLYTFESEAKRNQWVASSVAKSRRKTETYVFETRNSLIASILAVPSPDGRKQEKLSDEMMAFVDQEVQRSDRAAEMMLQMAVEDVTGKLITLS
ncbi:hypothetical protein IAR50_004902 [Cryptococcus sp. DSM 104548]